MLRGQTWRSCRSERDGQLKVSSGYKWYLREFFEITEPRGVVLESKYYWAKYRTLCYSAGMPREYRDGIIDWVTDVRTNMMMMMMMYTIYIAICMYHIPYHMYMICM